MSEPSNPLSEAFDRAVEAFVYAPIGLLFEGPDPFPDLVQKGRSQLTQAKLVGRFAVERGQGKACRVIEQRRAELLESLGNFGAPTPETAARASQRAPRDAQRPVATKKSVAPKPRQSAKPDLAIPDYDGLSASQVVTRLAGLSDSELEAVRVHEAANRARKTILNKVAQLQA